MNDISNSVVDKIKKLLALATSDNPNEAELAMIKAQRIAAENSVDISLIQIFDKTIKQAPIEREGGISLGQRICLAEYNVGRILQNHFNVKVIYNGNRTIGRKMAIIGTRENIEIARYARDFLTEKFMSLWKNYYLNNRSNGITLNHRNSYLLGLERGLSAKLEAEKNNVENEKLSTHTEETKQQFALMVVSEKERLQDYMSEHYPKLGHCKRSQARATHSENAMQSGYNTGQKITINRAIGFNQASNQISI